MASPDLDPGGSLHELRVLHELRGQVASQLAARLADGRAPVPELRELNERLSLLDTALAAPVKAAENPPGRQSASRAWPVVWPLLLVGGILLLAATVPVPSTPLTLNVQASSVKLGLTEATVLGGQAVGGQLRIEGFSALESPDPALAQASPGEQTNTLAIRGDQTQLRALNLPAGTELTLRAQGDGAILTVDSSRSPVVADIEMRGKTSLRLGDTAAVLEREFPHSEWLKVVGGDAAQPGQRAPLMTLSLAKRGEATLRIDALRPRSLQFSEPQAGAGIVSARGSSLDSGTLTLPSTGQTVPINGGDWLEIDGLEVQRCEVALGNAVSIKLTGSARVVRLKVGDFDRSLKPSWLEFVARHHLAGLLWGSAALLWGALAWVRKYFSAGAS